MSSRSARARSWRSCCSRTRRWAVVRRPARSARTRPSSAGSRTRARPGRRPAPERGGAGRRRFDGALAFGVLVLETLLCLSVWGPQPAAWLWVGSQVDYWTGSVFLGIVVAFLGVLATLLLTLSLCTRLDRV